MKKTESYGIFANIKGCEPPLAGIKTYLYSCDSCEYEMGDLDQLENYELDFSIGGFSEGQNRIFWDGTFLNEFYWIVYYRIVNLKITFLKDIPKTFISVQHRRITLKTREDTWISNLAKMLQFLTFPILPVPNFRSALTPAFPGPGFLYGAGQKIPSRGWPDAL